MIVARRTLKLKTNKGIVDVPVRVFAPAAGPKGSWKCRYEIDWPEGRWAMEIGGIDACQALLLAFYGIGSELYSSNYHKNRQLWFDAPGRGYGFPVPVSLRDLLEGDDKAFF